MVDRKTWPRLGGVGYYLVQASVKTGCFHEAQCMLSRASTEKRPDAKIRCPTAESNFRITKPGQTRAGLRRFQTRLRGFSHRPPKPGNNFTFCVDSVALGFAILKLQSELLQRFCETQHRIMKPGFSISKPNCESIFCWLGFAIVRLKSRSSRLSTRFWRQNREAQHSTADALEPHLASCALGFAVWKPGFEEP